jgi:hypothetical protein
MAVSGATTLRTKAQVHAYLETRLHQSLPPHDKVPVHCTFHNDKSPSATVFLTGGGGFNCHGCGFKGSLVDFEMKFSACDRETALRNIAEITGSNGGNVSQRKAVGEFIYRSNDGTVITAKKVRYVLPSGDKTFAWFHRDSAGRWQIGLPKSISRTLYNEHEVITANLVLFVEGEKCADEVKRLIPELWPKRQAEGLRIAVTTNPEGAWRPSEKPRWQPGYNKVFGAKQLIIFEDNDIPGKTLADFVASQLHSIAATVRRVAFPDQREKFDLADWIEERKGDHTGMIAELERMIEQASLRQKEPTEALSHSSNQQVERGQPAPETTAHLRPDLVCLADIEPRCVDWLWNPFIPARMLSILSGDPAAGKSYVALAVAADLSRGKLLDGRFIEPVNTIYLTCENPLAECVRPRFDLLGGDPARLFVLHGALFETDGEEERRAITLADIPILDAAISQKRARLVVADPLQSYLGANVDLHRSNQTRPVLDGLAKLAELHGCAILLVRHLSKQTGASAIHRGLGSIDLSGAARSEMLAGSPPDDPDSRALVHIKSNVGPMGHSLGYSINGEGKFSWTGESPLTALDLLAAPAGNSDRKLGEASRWLTEQLQSGSLEQKQIRERAERAGITYRTLRRAKDAVGVKSYRTGLAGPWEWKLYEGGQPTQRAKLDPLEAGQEPTMDTFEGVHNPSVGKDGHVREEVAPFAGSTPPVETPKTDGPKPDDQVWL